MWISSDPGNVSISPAGIVTPSSEPGGVTADAAGQFAVEGSGEIVVEGGGHIPVEGAGHIISTIV